MSSQVLAQIAVRLTFVVFIVLEIPGTQANALSPSDFQIGALELETVAAGKKVSVLHVRPTALARLLWELSQRTSIESELEPHRVKPSEPDLFRHPFLFFSASEAIRLPHESEIRNLRRHLTFGGTLFIDSAAPDKGGAYDRSIRTLLKKILPEQELVPLDSSHVVFKSFYLVDEKSGRLLRSPRLEGIFLDGRLAVIYSENDLAGAWARDAFGRYEFEVLPGGERQREMAFRLGVNVVMYALCLDYKDDLVHSPFISKRKR